MTIRRILLLAFLAVGVIPSTALGLLSLASSRDAMQAQIEKAVSNAVASTADDLDDLLYERAQNASTWTHIEVMQDLRLGDVDKRLSAFLAEMQRRYGSIYTGLHALDPSGRVVASSRPEAIGLVRPTPEPWMRLELPGGTVRVDIPLAPRGERRLSLRADIESAFDDSRAGELLLDIDWAAIEQVLDTAAAAGHREVLVVDRVGIGIAASAGLRARGVDFGTPIAEMAQGPAVEQRSQSTFMPGALIIGRSHGQRSGWTTLMLQSSDEALAPVRRMTAIFGTLLGATVLLTILGSMWVSGLIARPVQALTRFTREYLRPGAPPSPPRAGPGEVGELCRSFITLVEALERSQGTLVQASRLAALGEVTALMAHEVRTPIGIVRSSAQMLRSEPGMSGEAVELLNIIQSESDRLNRLVSSMLDHTRTRDPQPRAMNFHHVMAHAATLLTPQAREHGIEIDLDFGATDPDIEADPEQLTQVLLNVVGNALQNLQPGGRVAVRSRDEGPRLVCEVDDDGPGIPPQDRQRLFDPFVHKREGGLGLGLAVVRQIVRAHGGDVAATDSPLGGARIRFWLPRKPGTT